MNKYDQYLANPIEFKKLAEAHKLHLAHKLKKQLNKEKRQKSFKEQQNEVKARQKEAEKLRKKILEEPLAVTRDCYKCKKPLYLIFKAPWEIVEIHQVDYEEVKVLQSIGCKFTSDTRNYIKCQCGYRMPVYSMKFTLKLHEPGTLAYGRHKISTCTVCGLSGVEDSPYAGYNKSYLHDMYRCPRASSGACKRCRT